MRRGFIEWHVCYTRGQVLLEEGMCYGGHVFHESMCHGRTCVVGRHVVQVCAEAII